MIEYQYQPLPTEEGFIRLLRLLPSPTHQAEIHVDLIEYNLTPSHTSSHSYEALSYVWGSLDTTSSILVGDKRLQVTPNLHAALSQLRDTVFPRVLWVDAVCINQCDDVEKALQIRCMARIYASAKRTIVWLGKERDDSDEAFETIRAAGMGEDVTAGEGAARAKSAVQALLRRKWFRRIWVLQEVAAARHVVVCCGAAELDGHAFCIGLERMPSIADAGGRHAQALAVITLVREAIFRPRLKSNESDMASLNIRPLAELINMYSTLSATHRHDKIYALLGMATDDLNDSGLLPDYTVPWDELLRRLVAFLLGDNIRIETFGVAEKAVITGRGSIIGRVTKVSKDSDGTGTLTVKMNHAYVYDRGYKQNSEPWSLQATPTNEIRKDDVVYFLEGSPNFIIVRYSAATFHVVALAIKPPAPISDRGFYRTLPLQWEWTRLSVKAEPVVRYEKQTYLVWDIEEIGSCWSAALVWSDLSGSSWDSERMLMQMLDGRPHVSANVELSDSKRFLAVSSLAGPITEAELVEIIQRFCPKAIASLLTSFRREITITPEVLVAIARWQPDEVLIDLLDRDTSDLPITLPTVEQAGLYRPYTQQGMATLIRLLHRREPDKIFLATEPLLVVAARNQFADNLLRLILGRTSFQADITDAVLTAAVSNHFSCRKATLKLLLDAGDHIGAVDDAVLTAAFRSRKCHKETLQLLLALRGLGREIPEAFWVAAASNRDMDGYSCSGHGEERFRVLRTHEVGRKTKMKTPVTEEVLVAVASSLFNGRAIASYLMQRPGDFAFVDGIATEKVLIAAAENEVCGDVVMETLLKAGKDDTEDCITDPVVFAAMKNKPKGQQLVQILCKRSQRVARLVEAARAKVKV